MLLFRRLRRDKEEEPAPPAAKPAPETPAPSAKPTVAPAAPPEPVPVAPPVLVPEPAPAPTPAPTRVPPPLPDRPAESKAPPSSPADVLSRCFVCGTPLVDHACSTCRMTWVE